MPPVAAMGGTEIARSARSVVRPDELTRWAIPTGPALRREALRWPSQPHREKLRQLVFRCKGGTTMRALMPLRVLDLRPSR